MANLENEILLFLYERNKETSTSDIETKFDEDHNYSEVDISLKELQRLNLFYVRFENVTQSWYMLTQPIRKQMENLPIKYKDNPYEYFINKEQQKEKLQRSKDWKERHWLLIAAFSFILGFLADTAKEVYLQKSKQEKKESIPPTPNVNDTLQKHK
jgi:hypothetical protein